MNAHEFRIGNYVEIGGVVALVLAIDSDGKEALVETRTSNDNRIKTKISEVKPVAITLKLLAKHCHFGNAARHDIGIDDFICFLEFKEGYISLLDRKGAVMIRFMDIRNLHQLQNLYYALKGTEMEIKEFPLLSQ